MTPKTKIELKDSVEKRLGELTKELETLKRTSQKLNFSEKFAEERGLNVDFQGITNLINYRLFIGILTSDLCCAVLNYLNSKFQYQGLFSARQIIVIISEGYKKIYNFTSQNGQGDLVLTNRNNSFWIKEIGQLVNDLPEFQESYDSITEQLDEYLHINFHILKEQRDLSIHYDKEPMKVIAMLSTLDIEETFKKMLPLIKILNEMFSFTTGLNKAYWKKLDNSKKELDEKINDIQFLLTKSKTSENTETLKDLKRKILELNALLKK